MIKLNRYRMIHIVRQNDVRGTRTIISASEPIALFLKLMIPRC